MAHVTTGQTRRPRVRVGKIAVVDGVEYPARADYRNIWLRPAPGSPTPAGWRSVDDNGDFDPTISRDQVSALLEVTSVATLDSLRVQVLDVDDTTQTAGVFRSPGGGDSSFQIDHPPHPDLHPMAGNAASIDGWYGRVPYSRLTDIVETVRPLDLSTFGNPRGS